MLFELQDWCGAAPVAAQPTVLASTISCCIWSQRFKCLNWAAEDLCHQCQLVTCVLLVLSSAAFKASTAAWHCVHVRQACLGVAAMPFRWSRFYRTAPKQRCHMIQAIVASAQGWLQEHRHMQTRQSENKHARRNSCRRVIYTWQPNAMQENTLNNDHA